ncbi:3'-5' exonuclease [Diaphorobacter aerolatus]|uniref:3'-5' exonuclease domain-containing protein 2 n=1 Tax=Diaphorobacter aerolatus TaxID=1288495 RepID=A0A7H0GKD1_9BURK|nr:3'-5' exonuclease [Diaphorobacter aerolatus]QNP48747.1 3'-5' exonuclease domain-containing protein 2 [Diaphorobacter aerolatus]
MSRRKAPTKDESALLPPFAALPDSAIHVPVSGDDFEHARTALLQARVLGFDTESKPLFQAGAKDTGPHLVQFATCTDAWLLQMQYPQTFALTREVLGNAQITKVGFGLDNDRHQLQGRLQVEMQNVLDLDRVFKRHGFGSSTGVRAAIALVLGQSLRKSKRVTTSNWSNEQLSDSQRRYAANDAHAPAMVYAALAAWEAKQPPPPPQPQSAPRPDAATPWTTPTDGS